MRIGEAICMYAVDAHAITELARKPIDPWNKLFNRIKEEAEHGQFMLLFDEEAEGVKFKEHRKDVKKELELLGYSVSYSRQRDGDDYYGETYHNRYVIEW